jgi:hypothetical protein
MQLITLLLHLTLIALALSAPNPWGSYIDWTENAGRYCQDAAFEHCGGGSASVNAMIECVCTPELKSSLASCADARCTDEEAARLEDTRQAYCTRYTTTGSWTMRETGAAKTSAGSTSASTTATTGGGSTSVSTTATTGGVSVATDRIRVEALLGAGAVAIGFLGL